MNHPRSSGPRALKFVVWAPWENNSGGLIALHKLAHDLAFLGEDSYITSARKRNPDQLGKLFVPGELDPADIVAIYPEIVSGNPLGARHVVRWILNTPGICGRDVEATWDPTDAYFKYNDYFMVAHEDRVTGYLAATEMCLNMFGDAGGSRKGQCYLVHKGRNKPQDQHDSDAIKVDELCSRLDRQALNRIFNEKEMFVSYDHATYVSTQAALAGCLSVVIPDGTSTKEQWQKQYGGVSYGIAYGFDDLEHARVTQPLLRGYLKQVERGNLNSVRRFVAFCHGVAA